MKEGTRLLAAALVAVGLAVAGWCVGRGFVLGRTAADRYVTVKGVAERDVEADIALWTIRFVATDDELARAQAVLEQAESSVLEFLGRHGIPRERARIQALDVNDQLANPYRSGPYTSRFILTETLIVRSDMPEKVEQAAQAVGELVAAGVVLSGEGGYGVGPTYLFKSLSESKPEMIAEATANAREAARQFARDSGGRLGGIRRANQGVFVVLPRDQAPGISEEGQRQKTLRVVSTIDYYLED